LSKIAATRKGCRCFFTFVADHGIDKMPYFSLMLQGKKILLGVTGSIAAYKSILLVRDLVKKGAEVKVILTPAALDFVTPLSLSTLSKNDVLVNLFTQDSWANHVMVARWADIMVIAPLSCNSLAKMAHGLCDNLLLATYLSAPCPVVVAPAMDQDMWHHPSTRANIEKIKSFGNAVVDVDRGELASGLIGEGRMAEPENIVQYIEEFFFLEKDLQGKRALVSAGPTHEAIDPVRFIGNHSSGKMGVAIAREMAARGAQVDLVLGPTSLAVEISGVHIERVQSAEQMYNACVKKFPGCDIAVMAAAVADYRPAEVLQEKMKKQTQTLNLALVKTKDILADLGKAKSASQVLVGFALENRNEKQYAMEKLKSKHADLIVLNSLNDEGVGFGLDSNKITIFEKSGNQFEYEQKPKQQVAKDIVDRIVNILYA
jgi:phosphopantothenoylcysteine decarboxylase / phosphopantothenate---cysteine ligase